jgi:molybdenum cofactor cytidylyltransferase
VVLAAGAGSRFGGGKLLAPWGEGVLLDSALGAALAAPVREVVLVWGVDGCVPAAARALADRSGQSARLRLVYAARAAEGMAESLKAGVAALPADSGGAFVFLGDMPKTSTAVLPDLVRALGAGALAAAPAFKGRRGHPVLLSSALFPRLLALAGDRGAAAVLGDLGSALALVDSPDEGVLFDVDRPQDLTR